MDLSPDGATNVNNCFYETDVVNNLARITWRNVREYIVNPSSNTFQVIVYGTGNIEFIYQTCRNVWPGHNVIVGFSPGANNRDPGGRDLSTAMPFSTSADSNPLAQGAGRPVIGTTIDLRVSNIRPGSFAGLELIGPPSGGIDLTGAGATGCFLHVMPILVALPFATAGGSASIPLALPRDLTLVGGRASVQAATVSLGANPLGVLTSNLTTLHFGSL